MICSKYSLIVLMILLPFINLSAQEDVLRPRAPKTEHNMEAEETLQWKIGVEAGINYNMFNRKIAWESEVPQSIFNVYESGTGFSPYFAALLDVSIDPKWGVQLKVAYETRSFSNSYTGIADCHDMFTGEINDMDEELKYTVTGSDLGLSLMFRYNITNELILTAGPIFLFPFDNYEEETTETILSDGCYFPDAFGSIADSIKTRTTKAHAGNVKSRFGLDLGLGYKVDINESVYLTPLVRFNFTFTKIVDDFVGIDGTRDKDYGTVLIEETNAYLHSLKVGVGLWF